MARGALSKTFVFDSTLNYKAIRITIGDAGLIPLHEAKQQAQEWQRWIDEGKDPRAVIQERHDSEETAKDATKAAQEAAQAEEARRQRYTLISLCNAYADHLAAQGKARSAGATRSAFKCHVAKSDAATLPARDVTPHHIAAIVRKVREAGKERAAGILRAYLSAAFNCARRAPYDSSLPADMIPFDVTSNPVDAIPAIAVKRGERTLSEAELKAYIDTLGADLVDQSLKIALFAGGQRMAQLLRAKVGDWNPENNALRLWDGKGRRPQGPREHLLPLAPEAAAMVQALADAATSRETERAKEEGRKANAAGCWLFSAHGEKPMAFETPGKRAKEIAAGMPGEPFDLRDMRRTVETVLAGLGISKDTRAQLLSHGISGVQAAHYDRHSYTDEKRAALVAWEARLARIQKGKQEDGNVIELRQASA